MAQNIQSTTIAYCICMYLDNSATLKPSGQSLQHEEKPIFKIIGMHVQAVSNLLCWFFNTLVMNGMITTLIIIMPWLHWPYGCFTSPLFQERRKSEILCCCYLFMIPTGMSPFFPPVFPPQFTRYANYNRQFSTDETFCHNFGIPILPEYL